MSNKPIIRFQIGALAVELLLQISAFAQPHVAKIQIQGDDMDPMISVSWTKGSICTKQDGVAMLNKAWAKCTKAQKQERDEAYKQARDFISSSPANGRVGGSSWSRSFQNRDHKVKGARIDIEIHRGAAFSHDRHIVYFRIKGPDLSSAKAKRIDSKHIMGKKEAKNALKSLWSDLSKAQQDVREDAYKAAIEYIEKAPINGRTGSVTKEFKDSKAKSGEQIVIVIEKGAAFRD